MQNPIITVVYSHGRYGSPWYGFKIEALRSIALKAGLNIISVRYPEEMTVEQMEQKLFETVQDDVNVPGDLIFLSSSRGGYLSTKVSQKVINLYQNEDDRTENDPRDAGKILPRRHVLGQFLIAPAFYIKPDYYPDQDPTPATIKIKGTPATTKILRTTIVHGLNDSVIPCDNSIRFAKKFDSQLHLFSGDHRMNSQRDMLCILFENFIKDCVVDSNNYFSEWTEIHKQAVSQPD